MTLFSDNIPPKLKKYLIILVFAILLMMFGTFLNIKVIVANDYRMPVYKAFDDTEEHFGFWDRSEVNLFYLTARFVIGEGIYSLGDIFIIVGGFVLLFDIFNLFIFFAKEKQKAKQKS